MKITSRFENDLFFECMKMVDKLPSIDKCSSVESKRKTAFIIKEFVLDNLRKYSNDDTLSRNGNNRRK